MSRDDDLWKTSRKEEEAVEFEGISGNAGHQTLRIPAFIHDQRILVCLPVESANELGVSRLPHIRNVPVTDAGYITITI